MLLVGQIAKGNFNFTSMAEPSQREDVTNIESDGKHEDERELEKEVAANQTNAGGREKEKPKKILKKPKRSPKKSSGDALVEVMQRFMDIKEKERKKEDAGDFSITRCVIELRTLEGVTPDLEVRCYDVFKCAKNCEIFINVVAEKVDSALAWLQSKIGTLCIVVHTNLFFACFSYFDF
jgi:hypothetical protein